MDADGPPETWPIWLGDELKGETEFMAQVVVAFRRRGRVRVRLRQRSN